jgi:hypothetical protein
MRKIGLHRVAQLTLHAARIGLVSENADDRSAAARSTR